MKKNKKLLLTSITSVSAIALVPIAVIACGSTTKDLTQTQLNSAVSIEQKTNATLPNTITNATTTSVVDLKAKLDTAGITFTYTAVAGTNAFVPATYSITITEQAVKVTIVGKSGSVNLTVEKTVTFKVDLTQTQLNSAVIIIQKANAALPNTVTNATTTSVADLKVKLDTAGIIFTYTAVADTNAFVPATYSITITEQAVKVTIVGKSGSVNLTVEKTVTFTIPTSTNFAQKASVSNQTDANIAINGATAGPLFNLQGLPVEAIRKIATSDNSGVAEKANELYTNPKNQAKAGIKANIDFAFFQTYLSAQLNNEAITTEAQFNELEKLITWDIWSLGQFVAGAQNPEATAVTNFSALNGPSAWVILPNVKEGITPEQLTAFQGANPVSEEIANKEVFGAGNVLGGGRVWTQNTITLTTNDTVDATITLAAFNALFEVINEEVVAKEASLTGENLHKWFSSITLNGKTLNTVALLAEQDLTDIIKSLSFTLYEANELALATVKVTALPTTLGKTYVVKATNKADTTTVVVNSNGQKMTPVANPEDQTTLQEALDAATLTTNASATTTLPSAAMLANVTLSAAPANVTFGVTFTKNVNDAAGSVTATLTATGTGVLAGTTAITKDFDLTGFQTTDGLLKKQLDSFIDTLKAKNADQRPRLGNSNILPSKLESSTWEDPNDLETYVGGNGFNHIFGLVGAPEGSRFMLEFTNTNNETGTIILNYFVRKGSVDSKKTELLLEGLRTTAQQANQDTLQAALDAAELTTSASAASTLPSAASKDNVNLPENTETITYSVTFASANNDAGSVTATLTATGKGDLAETTAITKDFPLTGFQTTVQANQVTLQAALDAARTYN